MMGRRAWITRGAIEKIRAPLPLVEIAGDRRVLIEHHQGVSSYAAEKVAIRVGYGQVCVTGSGLCIARMTQDQLVVCGNIESVLLMKSGGHNGR